MGRVLTAEAAIFRQLQLLRIRLLVLRGRVVPALTLGTREADVLLHRLLHDLDDGSGADGAAALADREAQSLLHRDRRDQVDLQVHVVPRHHHLHTLRQLRRPRHVRRPEEKLRPIPVEKRRVPPALLLRQDVHLRR